MVRFPSGVIRSPLFTWWNSAVFLPDSHFAHQQYTQTGRCISAWAVRCGFAKSTWGCSYAAWASLFISPLSTNAIVPRGRKTQKCIFRERFAVIGSHHWLSRKRSLLNVILFSTNRCTLPHTQLDHPAELLASMAFDGPHCKRRRCIFHRS